MIAPSEPRPRDAKAAAATAAAAAASTAAAAAVAEEQSCVDCDKSLVGSRYIVHLSNSYCVPCYESKYANTCESCQALISTDCKDLAYKDKHWHDSCFVCSECKAHLLDKMFAYRSDKLYCADCFENIQALVCAACSQPFTTGMKKYEHRGKRWHEDCFMCQDCHAPIGNNAFLYYRNNPVCLMCYDNKYALHCTKCQKVISKGGLQFRGTPWHMECFVCTNCEKQLAGDKFTTHDKKQYCIDCCNKLFSDKCHRCDERITGVGKVKYVSFEGRTWHCKCFTCKDCNKSLTSEGFITKELEIYCAACAKK